MSLNGLDGPSVLDAFSAAIAEPGGWLVLKYTSRDTVDLLDGGKSGVIEARNALARYDEKSPLFGLLMFRRKRVLIKYIPQGTSRVLIARTNVHFPSISEAYGPHEAVLDITSADELNDTSLAAVFPLHTGAAAPTTGKLDEIMEGETDDDSGDGRSPARPPVQPRSASGTSLSRKELLAMKGLKYQRLPALPTRGGSATDTSAATESTPQIEEQPEDLGSETKEKRSNVPMATPPVVADVAKSPGEGLKSAEIAPVVSQAPATRSASQASDRRDTLEETGPASAAEQPAREPLAEEKPPVKRDEFDYAALDALLPPPELGPRPVPVAKGSRGSLASIASAKTSASLPAALKNRQKAVDRSSAPLKTMPMAKPTPIPSRQQPPSVPASIPPSPIRSTSSRSVRSVTAFSSKKSLTPEKQRMLKALELRKKQEQNKARAVAEAAPPSGDDPSGPGTDAKRDVDSLSQLPRPGVAAIAAEPAAAKEPAVTESPVNPFKSRLAPVITSGVALSPDSPVYSPIGTDLSILSPPTPLTQTRKDTLASAGNDPIILSPPGANDDALSPAHQTTSVVASHTSRSVDSPSTSGEANREPSVIEAEDKPTTGAAGSEPSDPVSNRKTMAQPVAQNLEPSARASEDSPAEAIDEKRSPAEISPETPEHASELDKDDGRHSHITPGASPTAVGAGFLPSSENTHSAPSACHKPLSDRSVSSDNSIAESKSVLPSQPLAESAERSQSIPNQATPQIYNGDDLLGTSFLHISPEGTGNALSSPVDLDASHRDDAISANLKIASAPAHTDESQSHPPNEVVTDEIGNVAPSESHRYSDVRPSSKALVDNSARKSDSGIQLACEEFQPPPSPEQQSEIRDESSNATLNDSLLAHEPSARTDSDTLSSRTDDHSCKTDPHAVESCNTDPHAVEANEPMHDSLPASGAQNEDTVDPAQSQRLNVPVSPVSNGTSPSGTERFSGATVDSDLMDAIDAATVHEATVAVSRSPSATFLRRNTSGADIPTLNKLYAGQTAPGDDDDQSSFGDLLVPTGMFNPRSSFLLLPSRSVPKSNAGDRSDLLDTSRRGSVKPGISQRIARLEQIRLHQSSSSEQMRPNQPSGTALPAVPLPDGPVSVDRRELRRTMTSSENGDRVMDRLRTMTVFNPARSSSVRNSLSSLQTSLGASARPHMVKSTSYSAGTPASPNSQAASARDMVSVTARIVRADDLPPRVPPKDDGYVPAEMRAPSITIDRKRATWTQTLSAKDTIALSASESSSAGTESASPDSPVSPARNRPSGERRLSFGRRKNSRPDAFTPHLSSAGEDTVSDLPGSPHGDEIDSPRGTNRATRFLKRMSTLAQNGQGRRKGPSPTTTSPTKSQVNSAATSPTKTETPAVPAIPLGGFNVQFPNSGLWKRRFVEIDATGTLVVAANRLAFGIHTSSTRKYRLGDFVRIYTPTLDSQELAHSIILDIRDGGGMLQCACEDASRQQHVLQVLLRYHAYWSDHEV